MAKDNSNHGGNMVMIVGTLLFLVSFFGPMSAEFNKAAEYHYLPDGVRVLAAVFAGVVSGLATVIAYLNTGYTRYKDSKQSDGSGKTTITAAVAPPTITLSSEEPKKVVAAEPKIG